MKTVLEFLYKNHVKHVTLHSYEVYQSKVTNLADVKVNNINDYDLLINNLAKTSNKTIDDKFQRSMIKSMFNHRSDGFVIIRPGVFGNDFAYSMYFKDTDYKHFNDKYVKIANIDLADFTYDYWKKHNWINC